ncbi:MAG TPA: hypothetical protein PKK10_05815 [Woeseiaceae bacterium]|nr:hypothetical protein [Woeseiaceae bacterium]
MPTERELKVGCFIHVLQCHCSLKIFIAITGSIFAISFLAFPLSGGSWEWDLNNALGFLALAGLLYLTVPFRGVRNLWLHEHFSYAVLGIVLIHAFWFLTVDGAALQYIRIGAPAYMWAGIVSVFFLGLSVWFATLPARQHVYGGYTSFRYWHRLFAIIAIAGATYHIVQSGFYLHTWYQSVFFIAIVVIVTFNRSLKTGIVAAVPARPRTFLLVGTFASIIFALLRNSTQ